MSDFFDMKELLEVLKDKATLDLLEENNRLRSENKDLREEIFDLNRQIAKVREVVDWVNSLMRETIS